MRWRWLLTLNGVFTISVVVLCLWAGSVLGFLYSWIPNYVQGETVTIPDLEGLPANEARQRALDLGLNINFAATEARHDSSQPRGYVISHVPAPKQTVKRTRPIRFIVSSGPERAPVPKLRDKTVGQAEFELSILGLRLGMVSYSHSERHATPQSIIASTPAAGVELTRGDRVHLLVSLGPRPVELTMPRLTGMTLAQARTALDEALLYVQTVERSREPRQEPNVVLAQNPKAGSRVMSGSGVTLMVNEKPAASRSRTVIIWHKVSGGDEPSEGTGDEGLPAGPVGPVAEDGAPDSDASEDSGDATSAPTDLDPGVDPGPDAEEAVEAPAIDAALEVADGMALVTDDPAQNLIRVVFRLRDDVSRGRIHDVMAAPGQEISFPWNVTGEALLRVYEVDMNVPVRRETLK